MKAKKIRKRNTKKYEDSLIIALQDPVEAAAYLNAHLSDDEGDGDSKKLFLLALRDVIKAQKISSIAKKAKLGRESLYKALSANGNPKIETILNLLKTMGLKLYVKPESEAA